MATINIITDIEQHQIATVGFEAWRLPARGLACARRSSREGTPIVRAGRVARTRGSRDNPFVTGELGNVRFYASHPLVTTDGVPFGTLCVFDEQPRDARRGAGRAAGHPGRAGRRRLRAAAAQPRARLQPHGDPGRAGRARAQSNERLAVVRRPGQPRPEDPPDHVSLSLALIREQLGGRSTTGRLRSACSTAPSTGPRRMADLHRRRPRLRAARRHPEGHRGRPRLRPR